MSKTIHTRQFFIAFRSYMLKRQQQQQLFTRFRDSHRSPLKPSAQPISSRTFHTSHPPLQAKQQPNSNALQTHYDFFPETLPSGPPPSGPFAVDLPALRKEFYALQAKAHPDLFPASDKLRAEGLSARINEAYKALIDPLRRAQYLLSLRGIDVAEDETARVEDPELLMQVLESREAIEGAEAEEELEPLREANEARIAESVAVLDQAFARDDLQTVKEEAVRLRYWMNIRESLDAWEKEKPVVLVH